MSCEGVDVYTLGFSNRTWEDTLDLLRAFRIERVVDVRSLPGSRKYPQFNLESLEQELPKSGIDYIHLKSLGGYRKAQNMGDINAGWRNTSFRNYADYAQTEDFELGLDELIRLFKDTVTVYCCTEAVPWRCHRSIISDFLLVRGFTAGDIMSAKACQPHKMTPFGIPIGLKVTYPAA